MLKEADSHRYPPPCFASLKHHGDHLRSVCCFLFVVELIRSCEAHQVNDIQVRHVQDIQDICTRVCMGFPIFSTMPSSSVLAQQWEGVAELRRRAQRLEFATCFNICS